MTISRKQLHDSIAATVALKRGYLEQHGWSLTLDNPGRLQLWRKVYMDDTYLGNMETALAIEEELSAR